MILMTRPRGVVTDGLNVSNGLDDKTNKGGERRGADFTDEFDEGKVMSKKR